MVYKLSDKDFEALGQRVDDGKAYLEEKWDSKNWETKQLVELWFDLSRQWFDQARLRNMFEETYDHEALMVSAQAKIERNRKRMETLYPKKGGRRKKPIESQSLSLFES